MSEPKVFLLPDLGEGLTEAELVNWLVAVGDEIRVDQPIAEVETAKSMVEVPSPYAGTVAVLHGEPGQTLDVGKPLISVMPAGASAAVSAGGAAADDAAPAPSPDSIRPADDAACSRARSSRAVSCRLAGCCRCRGLPRGGEGWVRECPDWVWDSWRAWGCAADAGPKRVAMAESVGAVSAAEKAADDLVLLRTRVPGKLGAVISPLVRRMARDHGVDLGELQGSGASGLIMRRDVEAVIKPSPVAERAGVGACRDCRGCVCARRTWMHGPGWAFPGARRCGECARPLRRTCRAAGPRSRKPRCGWMWTPRRSWRCVPR